MKKYLLILSMAALGLSYACTDEVSEMESEINVEDVIAPDEGQGQTSEATNNETNDSGNENGGENGNSGS